MEHNTIDHVDGWTPDLKNDPQAVQNRIQEIIDSYCLDNDVDKSEIHPQIWLDIIDEIHEKLFLVFPNMLKKDSLINNEYDVNKLYIIYIIYRRICNKHKMILNLNGYCNLTGVHRQTIYNLSGTSGSNGFDIYKLLMDSNEEILSAKLQEKGRNPMSILPILNHVHNWALPGSTKEVIDRRQLASRDNLDQIAASDSPKLPE